MENGAAPGETRRDAPSIRQKPQDDDPVAFSNEGFRMLQV